MHRFGCLILAALLLMACGSPGSDRATSEITAAAAATPVARDGFASQFDAALDGARGFHDGDLEVARLVVIYADVQQVDLRAQVTGNGFCGWFGVVGRVSEGRLVWNGGSPAGDCSE